MRLSDFDALSFDCYGTLIDWETGLRAALAPLLARTGIDREDPRVLEAFARHEPAQEVETPAMLYRDVLAAVHARLAREWGAEPDDAEARRFAASVGDWPAFPDTVEALAYLGRHFKLVILSNVDNTSFAATARRLGVTFDAVCTAEDIGSYKPDPRNFEALLATVDRLEIDRSRLLHVAESLFHDHAPANRAGITSVWIHRRHGKPGHGATHPPDQMPTFAARFSSLGELAAAHAAEQ